MRNPDKYISKGLTDRLNNMIVNGINIPCSVSQQSGSTQAMHYVLLHSQTKQKINESKCGFQWECTGILDAITRYAGTGNPGSRVLVNDIEQRIYDLMEDFTMEGLFLFEFEGSRDADIKTNTENMFRQLIRYRIIINN